MSHSQEQEQGPAKIASLLNQYFFLQKEVIHVHLNKDIFVNNEDIWFKGYVLQRKTGKPFLSTTNVYGALLDSDGNIIAKHLFYCNKGSFAGNFQLNPKYKSGKYYLQFYTNWMNNFSEDESSVYEVIIVNPSEGNPFAGTPDPGAVNISFYPEGGTIIKDATNIIGVKITGCGGSVPNVASLDIVDPKGEVLKKVPLTKLGYGRFDLAGNTEGIKAVVTLNGSTYEQVLPQAQVMGASLEVNNYGISGKTIIKTKLSQSAIQKQAGKKLFLVIHQDEKALIYNLNPALAAQELAVANDQLLEGVNTIRVIDETMEQLAERLIFKQRDKKPIVTISGKKINSDLVELTGTAGATLVDMSISVLPQNTNALTGGTDMARDFFINPYLQSRPVISRNLFDDNSKAKMYELDIFMLCQKSKNRWYDIVKNPPTDTYKFDIGIGMKAAIKTPIKDKKNARIRFISTDDYISKALEINDSNELIVDHLIATDSSVVSFKLLVNGKRPEDIIIEPTFYNNKRTFNKMFKPQKQECRYINNEGVATDLPRTFEDVIELDEVKIDKDQSELKYKRKSGNAQLRGFKITEQDASSFFYILDFINFQGFEVQKNNGRVTIYSGRAIISLSGQRSTPLVFYNGMQLTTLDDLLYVQTSDVEEIYLNANAPVPSIDARSGIIKIYMKKELYQQKKNEQKLIYVTDGFSSYKKFKRPNYSSYSDKGFADFGTIHWDGRIVTDTGGNFKVNYPFSPSTTLKLLIEGINPEGVYISEVRTLTLQ
ncbi:hypothetical protein CHU92_09135 [Flavobacterium cyanobacteriorum]|uniref:TonB-dependent receptor plug domain-containing protein n=2 Tax=Flavobacterium cyanobacteriorum TaxID=2022802 RepID=A0A255Z7M5_9FLAO|nr:hypothetical protein CHU92_09135 [Flavobacterium cyanobacteriorum]